MNFKVPDKKEIKEKYNISDEDFDIIVSSELPRATELSNSESFIEKVASYFGVPTFLIRKKTLGLSIIIAIIFHPYFVPKVSNELKIVL